MGKSLIDKLRKGARNLALVGTALAGIGLASCKFPGPDIIPPNPIPSSIDFTQVNNDLGSKLNEYNSFNDGNSTIENLPTKDNLGNPIVYTSVASPDGKTTPTLDATNYKLAVAVNPGSQPGDFKLNLEYNDNGKSGIATLDGYLYNLLDVTENIQNMDFHQPEQGMLQIFDASGNIPQSKISMKIGSMTTNSTTGKTIISTDSNGTTSFMVDARADSKSPLSAFTIKAANGNYSNGDYVTSSNGIFYANGSDKSYVRTIDFSNLTSDLTPSSDTRTNPAMRAKDYVDVNNDNIIGTFNSNVGTMSEIDGFLKHAQEMWIGADIDGQIFKDNIQNVDILSNNTVADYGSFTPEQTSLISSVLQGISNVISGGTLNPDGTSNPPPNNIPIRSGLSIKVDYNPAPYILNSKNYPIINHYWYIIMPFNHFSGSSIGDTIDTQNSLQQGIIDNRLSEIDTNWVIEENISHEAFRGLMGTSTQFPSTITLQQYSVMRPSATTPGPSYLSKGDQGIIVISREETVPAYTLISKVLGETF